jgi:hypothetical protein
LFISNRCNLTIKDFSRLKNPKEARKLPTIFPVFDPGYGLELIKKAIVGAIATRRAEDLTKASLPTYRQVPK